MNHLVDNYTPHTSKELFFCLSAFCVHVCKFPFENQLLQIWPGCGSSKLIWTVDIAYDTYVININPGSQKKTISFTTAYENEGLQIKAPQTNLLTFANSIEVNKDEKLIVVASYSLPTANSLPSPALSPSKHNQEGEKKNEWTFEFAMIVVPQYSFWFHSLHEQSLSFVVGLLELNSAIRGQQCTFQSGQDLMLFSSRTNSAYLQLCREDHKRNNVVCL